MLEGEEFYDVITIGSATVDVFAKANSETISFNSKDGEAEFIAFPLGDKILIDELEFLVGGGGTNTATAFSRLGFRTAYIGKIGSRANGQRVKKLLSEEGISFLGSTNGRTGYSIILDSIDDDRTILTFKGSNNDLELKDITKKELKTKWFYASSMMGESLKTLNELVDKLKEEGVSIAFNPSSYLIKENKDYVINIISKSKVVVMNLEEAQLLFGENNASSFELAPQ